MVERHVSGDRLSAFLDDELGEDEALLATRHLAWCDRCVGQLEALRATRDALRQLPNLQAPVLTAGVARHPRAQPRPRRTLRRLVALAAVPALFVGVVYVAGGDRGDIEPPTDLFLVEHVSRTGGGPLPGGGRTPNPRGWYGAGMAVRSQQ